ncbi:hypothetical protein Bbelb_172930 [Branchiostoma belcheri]|nr:hypothetical protein Bbelb_172930 [Branchiostoma belcheri]
MCSVEPGRFSVGVKARLPGSSSVVSQFASSPVRRELCRLARPVVPSHPGTLFHERRQCQQKNDSLQCLAVRPEGCNSLISVSRLRLITRPAVAGRQSIRASWPTEITKIGNEILST